MTGGCACGTILCWTRKRPTWIQRSTSTGLKENARESRLLAMECAGSRGSGWRRGIGRMWVGFRVLSRLDLVWTSSGPCQDPLTSSNPQIFGCRFVPFTNDSVLVSCAGDSEVRVHMARPSMGSETSLMHVFTVSSRTRTASNIID
jgi:hypothetical protein